MLDNFPIGPHQGLNKLIVLYRQKLFVLVMHFGHFKHCLERQEKHLNLLFIEFRNQT